MEQSLPEIENVKDRLVWGDFRVSHFFMFWYAGLFKNNRNPNKRAR